jgi:hypothetical protein
MSSAELALTGGLSLGDNVKANFGASDDLQIYHSGSNSHITDAGTGNLIIRADDLRLQSNAGEEYLSADSNGALALRYDNSTKLATTATGIDVTGKVNGLEINTTATSNLGLGTSAVDSITTGGYNVGVGDYALTNVTSGAQNIAVGYQSLYNNTSASYNTATGFQALYSNTTGTQNTAVGRMALYNNITSPQNTAVGYNSLYSMNDAGVRYNTAVGWGSGFNTTTGYNATFIGHTAGNANTTGSGLVAVGSNALAASTTGTQLVAVGNQALLTNTTGSFNTAIGDIAMRLNTTGSNNTASGYNALNANTTGANNTALGYAAGDNITTGSSNIIIGASVDAPSATASNQLNIGGWITGAAGAITVPGSLTTAGFTSTGIDDNATSTLLTVSNNGVIITGGLEVGNGLVTRSKAVTLTTTFQDVVQVGGRGTYKITIAVGDASATSSAYGHSTAYIFTSGDWAHQGATEIKIAGILTIGWKATTTGNTADHYTLQAKTISSAIQQWVVKVEIISPYANTSNGTGNGAVNILI